MRHRKWNWLPWMVAIVLVGGVVWGATGCSHGERANLVPVSGKVMLDGKPLEFGAVAFQPMRGQPARGTIGKDGTFKLSTHREGDGATVGQQQVKITCYTSQDPAAVKSGPSETLGESLIPVRYTSFDTSGLTVAVLADGNAPFVFELTRQPGGVAAANEGEALEGDTKPAQDAVKAADEPVPSTVEPAPSGPSDAAAPAPAAAIEPAAGSLPANAKTDGK